MATRPVLPLGVATAAPETAGIVHIVFSSTESLVDYLLRWRLNGRGALDIVRNWIFLDIELDIVQLTRSAVHRSSMVSVSLSD